MAVKTSNLTRKSSAQPWGRDESRIVLKFTRRLLAGRYAGLVPAAADCLVELRRWYAAGTGAVRPERVYPRTFDAVRSRISGAAIARGRPKTHKLWSPVERRLAYKWIRKYYRHRQDACPLTLLDAARVLLVDLLEHGYERSLAACENELFKCRHDAVKGRTRHAGRVGAETRLPASLLRGTSPQADRTRTPAWTYRIGTLHRPTGPTTRRRS